MEKEKLGSRKETTKDEQKTHRQINCDRIVKKAGPRLSQAAIRKMLGRENEDLSEHKGTKKVQER